jgi:hypothetical protein
MASSAAAKRARPSGPGGVRLAAGAQLRIGGGVFGTLCVPRGVVLLRRGFVYLAVMGNDRADARGVTAPILKCPQLVTLLVSRALTFENALQANGPQPAAGPGHALRHRCAASSRHHHRGAGLGRLCVAGTNSEKCPDSDFYIRALNFENFYKGILAIGVLFVVAKCLEQAGTIELLAGVFLGRTTSPTLALLQLWCV